MTNTGGDIEKEKHLLLLGVKTGANIIDISVRFFKRLETALPYDPAIPPLGMYPKDCILLQRCLLSHGHWCSILKKKKQEMETT